MKNNLVWVESCKCVVVYIEVPLTMLLGTTIVPVIIDLKEWLNSGGE